MKWFRLLSFCILTALISTNGFSQLDSARISTMTREEIMGLSQDDLLSMSMEDLVFLAGKMGISIDELLNMKTTVASKTTLTPRETPGIVSFITEDEIRKSGARDLIDVLRLVPGFDFGNDVGGVMGVGLRGNWVHEGKILILMDGQPYNELSYYNTPFGNHFPLDQIKRIEIIRGPGSAIYGGNAELGVINIITKSGKDIHGAELSATYGQMEKAMGRTNIGLNTGTTIKNWDISAKGFLGKANRTDQIFVEYIDNPDNRLDYSKEGSGIQTSQLNLGATNDKLSFRLIYDDYKTNYTYWDFDSLRDFYTTNEFRSILGEVKYNLKVNDKLTITPKFNYRNNRPFYEEGYWRNYTIDRYAGSVVADYQAGHNLKIVSGIDYYHDKGQCTNKEEAVFFSTNTNTLQYNNYSAFAEATYKWNKLNVIGGYRAEYNSNYGWASAPRLGITGVFNKFHIKTLVSGAFRSPAIGNIEIASDIKPEKSYITEIEAGYRINNNMFITANLYDILIKDCLVYFDTGSQWRPILDYGYINSDNAGSDGVELEFKTIYAKGYATVNYSYFTQAFRSIPPSYAVEGHKNSALGMAQHKFGFYGSYKFTDKLAISPSYVFLGKKYGYATTDDDGNAVIGSFGPWHLVNLSLSYEDLFIRGLDVSLSVNDLLNQKPPLINPYETWYYPYPGSSREILLKIVLSTDMFKN